MTGTTSPETGTTTWPEVFRALMLGQDLEDHAAGWAMGEMMSGDASEGQVGAFLLALAAKGVTVPELRGLTDVMVRHARPVHVEGETLDIVGTGGDRLGTVNLSTMSSLVAAGCGVRIVKHGNRGASSTAGAADVIEALGVDLSMPRAKAEECAEAVGITFLFAQHYHPSMKHVAPVRKQLGVPTVFNFLGPLSNPAQVTAQALGCSSEVMVPLLAQVLADRGVRGFVFRGSDGRDKITTSGPSTVMEVRGEVTAHELDPRELGIELTSVEALAGKDGAHNATLVRALLAGEKGPIRDAVLLNAAAGLTAADPEADAPLMDRLAANMRRAAESLDSGAAADVLDRWIEFSRS
ncbi:anthranilate phosphoribosyltransferase [Micrococcus sp. 2A]|uniref:anthranilate phosphoribosyltransferase n=1 Tax=Micrococcus TaxID=1269 RepID=UPI0020058D36|nr:MULTISPECIES: anthranilate phosphoribosyltransferase [unclassified Micrococcus]MCK6094836.1 anthranilate phosphoribosyltransferase [Micrococcus sp. EYE_212]MCK6170783.1 anthranilate phosphoribosyltransferase [Micrococcus sp. EYE_162]